MYDIINTQTPLLSLDEVSIIPSKTSFIHSRTKDCNSRDENGKLPIFIAPMDSIICNNNYDLFNKDLYAIIPRTFPFQERLKMINKGMWVAFGLKEIETVCDMVDKGLFEFKSIVYICIDQANGHMDDVVKVGKRLRKNLVAKDSQIMIGNIANPETYRFLYKENFADWVRIGIGGGSACTTSVQTGVHYPMASLISECVHVKHNFNNHLNSLGFRGLKIIADGGIGNSGDICKALALGADAVMCGKLFATTEESASPYIYTCNNDGTSVRTNYKEYWGMSTKRSQRNMGGEGNKNSEGVINKIKVECKLEERINQIESSIKSAMSYCNARELKEFENYATLTRITPTSFNAYNKEIQNA